MGIPIYCFLKTFQLYYLDSVLSARWCVLPTVYTCLNGVAFAQHSEATLTRRVICMFEFMCVCGECVHYSLSGEKLHCALPRLGPHSAGSKKRISVKEHERERYNFDLTSFMKIVFEIGGRMAQRFTKIFAHWSFNSFNSHDRNKDFPGAKEDEANEQHKNVFEALKAAAQKLGQSGCPGISVSLEIHTPRMCGDVEMVPLVLFNDMSKTLRWCVGRVTIHASTDTLYLVSCSCNQRGSRHYK